MIAKRPVARLIHAFSTPLTLPMINDITTTPDHPPGFLVSGRRGCRDYPVKNRELQRQAYPDLAPLRLARPARQVFELARSVASGLRDWRLIAERERDGSLALQYVAITPYLRFRNDVLIEVKPEGDSACSVHLRSRSRIGRADLGTNAQRIRIFLRALKKRAAG